MPFVKLDCGILSSSLWPDLDARVLFITALLMAEPRELASATPTLRVTALRRDGWKVPPGWYGWVPAASTGIIDRSGLPRKRAAQALEKLSRPDPDSRSRDYDGRRLVRVDGGFVVLNYQKYRDRDYGAAERMRRYRERQKDLRAAADRDAVTLRKKKEKEKQKESGGEIPPPPTPPGVPEADMLRIVDAFMVAAWRGTPSQLTAEVRACLAAGRTTDDLITFLAAHPGSDVFDLGRNLVPRVAAAANSSSDPAPAARSTSTPIHPRECACGGTGMRDTIDDRGRLVMEPCKGREA